MNHAPTTEVNEPLESQENNELEKKRLNKKHSFFKMSFFGRGKPREKSKIQQQSYTNLNEVALPNQENEQRRISD